MDKLLLKNWGFWSIVANVVFLATIIIMAIVWSGQSCPKPTKPQLDEIHLNKIKEIQNAETKNDVDSLLIDLYGFKSK